MKIVKLWGGLGNQLFQYSFGEYLKKITNEEIVYVNQLGVCDFTNSPLNEFNCFFSKNNSEKYFSYYFNWNYRFKRKVFQLLPLLSNQIIVENLKEPFCRNSLKYILFDGYWQDLNFIDFNRHDLKLLFTPKEESIIAQSDLSTMIFNCDSAVSVHMRRKDFLTSSYHNVLTFDYYQNAINQVLEHVNNPTFFIFSDDITWVKNNFNFCNTKCHFTGQNSNKSVLIDFSLMSNCKHHIIANSTFSWWAAWLNDYQNKIVIAPENWYRYNNELAKRILPKEWILI